MKPIGVFLALTTLLGGAGADSRTPLHELMAAARVPGLTLAEIRNGEIVRLEVAGVANAANGKPVTRETLFEAASLSKPVFATIVLRLAGRDRIDLDRPLVEYLSDERLHHDPRARRITARMVLAHRSGLPNWGRDRLELAFDPGGGFKYSGEGYVYLQRVLESITGLSLDELARREVFEPLGMTRSRFSWREGEAAPPGIAAPHDVIGRPQVKRIPYQGNAAASLHTTAEEYARFVVSWMNGGASLLGSQLRKAALEPQVRMQGGETAAPKPAEVWQRITWGLGWGLLLPPPERAPAATGTDDAGSGQRGPTRVWHWGDNGPSKAFVGFDAQAGDGLIYFANGFNGLAIGRALMEPVIGPMNAAFTWAGYEPHDAPGFAERLAGLAAAADGRWQEAIAAFTAALAAAPDDRVTATRIEWLRDLERARSDPVHLSRETLRRYAGTYGPRHLWLADGALHYRRDQGREYVLVPLSERLFALSGLPDFRLEVVVDEAGEPTGLIGHYADGGTDETPRGK